MATIIKLKKTGTSTIILNLDNVLDISKYYDSGSKTFKSKISYVDGSFTIINLSVDEIYEQISKQN